MAGALDRIWKRLNQELFRTLGPDRYSLWIRHALPATFDEEHFTVHFPTTHAKEKIESLLREAVTAAAQRVTNRNVRVLFTVDADSFVASADEAPAAARAPTFATFVAGPGNRPALAAAKAFARGGPGDPRTLLIHADRKSTRLNSSHLGISYAVFCLKKK